MTQKKKYGKDFIWQIHELLKSEDLNTKVDFSKFAMLRPASYIAVGLSMSHNVCGCTEMFNN